MDDQAFYKLLLKSFPYNATDQQKIALQKLSRFLLDTEKDKLFLLKGYAGTGKTTIIGTLVKKLWELQRKSVMAAPTGRAAKVMANYSEKTAFTIHRKIYAPRKKGAQIDFVLQKNKHKDTVFIVDEASMISDNPSNSKFFENGSLLDDLIDFVYSGQNCQLILIGDTAQLPPVKLDLSPALDGDHLALQFNKQVDQIELDEVMRQEKTSGILYNATLLRNSIQDQFPEEFRFEDDVGQDFSRLIDGQEVMNAIDESYSNSGHEETAIIVRSNKRANLYNQQIRSRILFRESEIEAGDFLMVVKNNYFWLKPSSEAGFIANGDIVEVLEIFGVKELYGFRFADVKVKLVDYPNMDPFETVVMLDTLTLNSPSLPWEESNKLYKAVNEDYMDVKSKYKRFQKVKNNRYFNALQVKFSYAMTCHKSQGGQWKNVFVEQPYLRDGINKEYLRWLYTACTRATENLYLLGFSNDHFKEKTIEENSI